MLSALQIHNHLALVCLQSSSSLLLARTSILVRIWRRPAVQTCSDDAYELQFCFDWSLLHPSHFNLCFSFFFFFKKSHIFVFSIFHICLIVFFSIFLFFYIRPFVFCSSRLILPQHHAQSIDAPPAVDVVRCRGQNGVCVVDDCACAVRARARHEGRRGRRGRRGKEKSAASMELLEGKNGALLLIPLSDEGGACVWGTFH